MANVPFSVLHDQILPYLPGAEIPLVNAQIRKAAREFLKRTTVLRQSFEFTTVQDSETYQFNPTFGEVSSILFVYLDGSPTPLPVAREEDRSLLRSSDKPMGWFAPLPHWMSMYPIPNAAYSVRVEAAITLTQTDTEIPEDIVRQYAEQLAAGTLSLMYSMPGKPWTQTQSSKETGRLFGGQIKTIRGSLRDGGQPNVSTFAGIVRFGK